MPEDGELPRTAYLRAAEEAFAFLNVHNASMTNDGKENILDDYCALLATTNLFNATSNRLYLEAADQRANRLMARLTSSGAWRDFWRADDAPAPTSIPRMPASPSTALSNMPASPPRSGDAWLSTPYGALSASSSPSPQR
jgi:uncharacterized protein YyaL (SSP411 family)